jgi:hypothetical protein
MQSCRQSISAPREKAGARLNAQTESRTKRQRSAREAKYRSRPIGHEEWWSQRYQALVVSSPCISGGVNETRPWW